CPWHTVPVDRAVGGRLRRGAAAAGGQPRLVYDPGAWRARGVALGSPGRRAGPGVALAGLAGRADRRPGPLLRLAARLRLRRLPRHGPRHPDRPHRPSPAAPHTRAAHRRPTWLLINPSYHSSRSPRGIENPRHLPAPSVTLGRDEGGGTCRS